MSLRWKMTLQIAAMLVGLLLVSTAALWGLKGLKQDYGLALVRTLSHDILTAVNERQKAGTHKWNTTLLVTAAICALVVLGAVLLGVMQYRSVMTPLNRLSAGVRKIAAAEFSQRLDERGSE